MTFVLDCNCRVGVYEMTSARDERMRRRSFTVSCDTCDCHTGWDISIIGQGLDFRPSRKEMEQKDNG